MPYVRGLMILEANNVQSSPLRERERALNSLLLLGTKFYQGVVSKSRYVHVDSTSEEVIKSKHNE